MCFDAAQTHQNFRKEALRFQKNNKPVTLQQKWPKTLEHVATNYYHINGFNHPNLLAYHWNKDGLGLNLYSWGLIPRWVNSAEKAAQLAKKTLNARGETVFEKPSFRDAAKQQRIVLPLDGFYEHHHKKGKKIPHFIQAADGRRLMIAAIASEWLNTDSETIHTFSIVTCVGNKTMASIHNNPKLKGPRMPLLLDDEQLMDWLTAPPTLAQEIIRPNNKLVLNYYPVRPLRGKSYLGNCPEIQQEYQYPETYDPPTLFG